MTRKQFIDFFGEAPEDVLGNDWKNEIEEMKVLKSVEYDLDASDYMEQGNDLI